MISLEQDILTNVAGQGKVFAFMNDKFWMSIKSAGSAIYGFAKQVYFNKF